MKSQTKSLKFDYKSKYLRNILILGIMYLVLGFSSLYFNGYGFLTILVFFGFLALSNFYLWKTKGYVSIDKKGIHINRLWSRHIPWKDFKGMRYYTDSIKLLYNNKSVDIQKDFLIEEDLKQLEVEIKRKLPISS